MHTKDTIRTLNGLIRVCRDGELYCSTASGRVASAELGALLRRGGEEWSRLGDELQALVLLLNGVPATTTTLAARLRQSRLVLRRALLGPTDATVIADWQRAQQQAEERYGQALERHLPARIRRTLTLQADRVVNRMVRVCSLPGQYAVHTPGP